MSVTSGLGDMRQWDAPRESLRSRQGTVVGGGGSTRCLGKARPLLDRLGSKPSNSRPRAGGRDEQRTRAIRPRPGLQTNKAVTEKKKHEKQEEKGKR